MWEKEKKQDPTSQGAGLAVTDPRRRTLTAGPISFKKTDLTGYPGKEALLS